MEMQLRAYQERFYVLVLFDHIRNKILSRKTLRETSGGMSPVKANKIFLGII